MDAVAHRGREHRRVRPSLGNLTTGVDRSTLKILGQTPNETTLSLDDGAPYYPTITAISESPLKRGLLYAGTDDGNLQVSRDDGQHWTNVAKHIPGVPQTTWVTGVEASRHGEGTVLVAFDGHRGNDFNNYVFRSTDYGATWTSIAGDLPIGDTYRATVALLDTLGGGADAVRRPGPSGPGAERSSGPGASESQTATSNPASNLRATVRELQTRLATLYRAVSTSTGRPTADQQSQMKYFGQVLGDLKARAAGARPSAMR